MFKKIIKLLCGLLTVALCSLFLYLYTIQESLLFKSEALVENHKFSSPHTFEEVFFATEDGARIHALHYRADHPKGVVVYFHGRSGNLATYWGKFAGQFLSQDYDVIMMDYRGFGKSRGKLSQELFLKDAGLVYDYAAKLYAPHQIVIYGCSLGTGIATYIASQYEAKLLILEAPYISILHLAMVEFPHVPKKLLSLCLKYPLPTYEWIKQVKAPIEIFHGKKDQLIPHSHGEYLYDLAKNTTQAHLTSLKEGSHNNLSYQEDYQKQLHAILQ